MAPEAAAAQTVAEVVTRPYRALAAAWAVLITLVLGGWGGLHLITVLHTDADRRLQQDAARFAESVARSLASQYAKAGQHDIPFEQIPGNQGHLERVLRDTPGVVRIALIGADGRVLFQAGSPATTGAARQTGEAAAPIAGRESPLGEVRVRVAPAALGDVGARWTFPLALALIALAVGAAAAWGPGRDLAARHRRLALGLAQGQAVAAAARGDALDTALGAVHLGQTRVQDKLQQLESLAEELLAVDFDDALAPEIARIRQTARDAVARDAGA